MGIINSVSNFGPFRIISWYKKSDMREHLYDARKEILLAAKSVIDDGIKWTESEKKEAKKKEKKDEKKEEKDKEVNKEEKKEAKKEEKKKEEKKEVKKETEKDEKVPKVETTIKW